MHMRFDKPARRLPWDRRESSYRPIRNGPWSRCLPDPASALGGSPSGEPTRDAEPFHDRSDVAADGRDADAGAARDRGVRQAFGHQLQQPPLGRRQLVLACCRAAGRGDRGGAVPQQLEVLAQISTARTGPATSGHRTAVSMMLGTLPKRRSSAAGSSAS